MHTSTEQLQKKGCGILCNGKVTQRSSPQPPISSSCWRVFDTDIPGKLRISYLKIEKGCRTFSEFYLTLTPDYKWARNPFTRMDVSKITPQFTLSLECITDFFETVYEINTVCSPERLLRPTKEEASNFALFRDFSLDHFELKEYKYFPHGYDHDYSYYYFSERNNYFWERHFMVPTDDVCEEIIYANYYEKLVERALKLSITGISSPAMSRRLIAATFFKKHNRGLTEIATDPRDSNIIKALLALLNTEDLEFVVQDKYVDLDALDEQGKTHLMRAAEKGDLATVRFLMGAKRINPDKKDNAENSAIKLAALASKWDIVQFLLPRVAADIDILIIAICEEKIDIIQLILQDLRFNINAKGSTDVNALHRAVNIGNLEIIKCLVEAKTTIIDLNPKFTMDHTDHHRGYTPLLAAATHGNLEIVKYLCGLQGIDLDAVDYKGRNALMLAAKQMRYEIVEFLVQQGKINIHEKDDKGRDALMWAMKIDCWDNALEITRLKIIQYLVKVGMNVNSENNKGKTLVMYAANTMGDALSIVKYLIQNGANVHKKDKNGRCLATHTGNADILQFLFQETGMQIDEKDEEGMSPLMHFVKNNGEKETVKLFLQHGANVNATDNSSKSVLMWASEAVFSAYQTIPFLVQQGAHINSKDKGGKVALIWAIIKAGYYPFKDIENGLIRIIKCLVGQGANVHVTDNDGKNVIMWSAIIKRPISYESDWMIQWFAKQGVDINARDKEGRNALMLAIIHRDDDDALDMVKHLVQQGADIKAQDNNGNSPLTLALALGNVAVAQYLIQSENGNWKVEMNEFCNPMLHKERKETVADLTITLGNVNSLGDTSEKIKTFCNTVLQCQNLKKIQFYTGFFINLTSSQCQEFFKTLLQHNTLAQIDLRQEILLLPKYVIDELHKTLEDSKKAVSILFHEKQEKSTGNQLINIKERLEASCVSKKCEILFSRLELAENIQLSEKGELHQQLFDCIEKQLEPTRSKLMLEFAHVYLKPLLDEDFRKIRRGQLTQQDEINKEKILTLFKKVVEFSTENDHYRTIAQLDIIQTLREYAFRQFNPESPQFYEYLFNQVTIHLIENSTHALTTHSVMTLTGSFKFYLKKAGALTPEDKTCVEKILTILRDELERAKLTDLQHRDTMKLSIIQILSEYALRQFDPNTLQYYEYLLEQVKTHLINTRNPLTINTAAELTPTFKDYFSKKYLTHDNHNPNSNIVPLSFETISFPALLKLYNLGSTEQDNCIHEFKKFLKGAPSSIEQNQFLLDFTPTKFPTTSDTPKQVTEASQRSTEKVPSVTKPPVGKKPPVITIKPKPPLIVTKKPPVPTAQSQATTNNNNTHTNRKPRKPIPQGEKPPIWRP